jgi:pimeloyl-ACP methyl ester carboxylesterase
MTNSRKHAGILRSLGALILAALLSAAMLYGLHAIYQANFNTSAMTMPYYLLFAISTFVLFLLLFLPANRPAKGFKTFVRWFLIIILGLGIWAAGAVWNLQNERLFLPGNYQSADAGLVKEQPNTEHVSVQGKGDLMYDGWLWKNAPQGKAGLIIYFGGNGEFAARATYTFATNAAFAQALAGFNILTIDYPGYGISQGVVGEEGIHQMALAAWDYAHSRADVDITRIVLAGWSLGTGAASRLADEKEPAGLILMAPFYSGAELLNNYVGFHVFDGWFSRLVRNKFQNNVHAVTTDAETLVIAAKDDDMIPSAQAERLAALYPRHTYILVAGGHDAAKYSPESGAAIYSFLQRILTK